MRSASRSRSSSSSTIDAARAIDAAVSGRVAAGQRRDEIGEIEERRQRDLGRRGAVARRDVSQHPVAPGSRATPLAAERAMREDRNVVRDAISDHAAEDRVVAPHAELDLNGRDRRDGARLFDLADGDVAQADRLDEPVASQFLERPDARRQRRARIGRVQLVELDALDTERLPACPTGVGQVARAAVR